MSDEAKDIASTWLSSFGHSLCTSQVQSAVSSFLPDGWLRDVLVLTWNNRSLAGQAKISSYLTSNLEAAAVSNVRLDERRYFLPEFLPSPSALGLTLAFTFETSIAHCRGYSHLVRVSSSNDWKALYVFLMMDDLKGHEEQGPESGNYGQHTLSWEEVNSKRRTQIECNPHVLIIGAGQTGLQIAARFKQMNISAIVIDQNARVGDNWRKRYPTLSLHTPRTHHLLLYQPYPKNWPRFTPRDKLASWLEQYVDSQDLIVWTNSRIDPVPTFSASELTWDITVDRNGIKVSLHPRHIVIATGVLGPPRIPPIPNQSIFYGQILHSIQYQGGIPFKGKRVLVLGAGNTSADICQDLVTRGAESVTMVQRSSTCIMSAAALDERFAKVYPEDVPIEVSDFKVAAMPLGLLRILHRAMEKEAWERDKNMFDGLQKSGFALNMGRDGSGQLPLIYERAGGYWIDVGCADLISSGKVKVKSGTGIDRFETDGVVFTDGSSAKADVVIFATGYKSSRDTMADIFGADVIACMSDVWGLDEEEELKGCYRLSGHPGLWFGAGDFHDSRFSSKQLALEIKAIELGLMSVPV